MTHLPILACLIAFAAAVPIAGHAADAAAYSVGSWPAELGNHRARVKVSAKADAVWAHIPWRRSDDRPQDKAVIVCDPAGKQIANVAPIEVGREYGDIVFQADAPGEYSIYYMPFKVTKPEQWQYAVAYDQPASTADPTWLQRSSLTADKLAGGAWKSLPSAELVDFQARTEFDRLDPMGVIATRAEVDDLLKRSPLKSCLLFPEDRRFPIHMTGYLPQRWISRGPSDEFSGEAARGEYYTFQVGVYAARAAIDSGKEGYNDVQVSFGGMRSKSGGEIPPDGFTCFNLMGTDWLGRQMWKSFKVPFGKVRPLWFGLRIPQETAPGDYTGAIAIKIAGAPQTVLKLGIKVTDEVLEDAGDSDLWRMSRLRWLDSTIGLDDTVVAPYTMLKVTDNGVGCLGRDVRFSRLGLPESMKSGGREILARPIGFVVETAQGAAKWGATVAAKIASDTGAELVRESAGWSDSFNVKVMTKTDFDGYTNCRLLLEAKNDCEVKDIRLEVPIRRDLATYMMGLGHKGGYRKPEWKWTWDIERANNQIWVGEVDAGLQVKLKGNHETWDISDLKSWGIPESWGNGGKGGCNVVEEGEAVVIRAYSGARAFKKGQTLEYRFGLLPTPVKPLDPKHFSQRYYHSYAPVAEAKATGANIINIHQGNELNPYINYPFLTLDKMASYVKTAHDAGMKVKIYYTVRELSNHAAELWALRSLGDEIFTSGPGGGDPWLIEHLGSGYDPAWREKLSDTESDAAIRQTGLSRWHNYYLEGLAWLMENIRIDGLYLDGIGYDREIMKRLRRAMDHTRMGSLIDFHSGNEFDFHDLRISPACKYMEQFPYINSLWFGEGYDPNESPDYWLVEMSGIPFGLYSEMLQGGGNPYRGMLYGMSNRLGWQGDPRSIWKVWDDFGISEAKMIGYWSLSCPVKTGSKDILATVYVKPGAALVAIASWAKDPARIKLDIDWKALGIDIRKADMKAPAVPGFQEAADFQWSGEISVEPGKGWLLLIKSK